MFYRFAVFHLISLIDFANLEKGSGLWELGRSDGGVPTSAITRKPYNGVNRHFFATCIDGERVFGQSMAYL